MQGLGRFGAPKARHKRLKNSALTSLSFGLPRATTHRDGADPKESMKKAMLSLTSFARLASFTTHTLLPIACLKRQEADLQSKPSEAVPIHLLKEFCHRAVNLASTVVRASNQLFEPIHSLTLPPPLAHFFRLSSKC